MQMNQLTMMNVILMHCNHILIKERKRQGNFESALLFSNVVLYTACLSSIVLWSFWDKLCLFSILYIFMHVWIQKPWFTNASIEEQFCSGSEAFGKMLLLFTNSTSGDEYEKRSSSPLGHVVMDPLDEIPVTDRLEHRCCEYFCVLVLYHVIKFNISPKSAEKA